MQILLHFDFYRGTLLWRQKLALPFWHSGRWRHICYRRTPCNPGSPMLVHRHAVTRWPINLHFRWPMDQSMSSYVDLSLSVWMSVCLSVYLSVSLSVYLSVCLMVFLSWRVCELTAELLQRIFPSDLVELGHWYCRFYWLFQCIISSSQSETMWFFQIVSICLSVCLCVCFIVCLSVCPAFTT